MDDMVLEGDGGNAGNRGDKSDYHKEKGMDNGSTAGEIFHADEVAMANAVQTFSSSNSVNEEVGMIQPQPQQAQHLPNASTNEGVEEAYATWRQQHTRQQQSTNEDYLQYAGGENDDEDEYEDPEDMIREFGRHPMMDRVQEALYNQLLQTYERVSEELRDKNADVKK